MIKFKPVLFFCLMLGFTTCSNPQTGAKSKEEVKDEKEPMLGADEDEHGCKGSAGYQWSVVKNECIRIFEAGIRMDARAAELDTTLAAFVVFKSDTDDQQAEIFLPNEHHSVLLNKVKKEDAGTWKNAAYTLTQWRGMYSLVTKDTTLLYQGAAVK